MNGDLARPLAIAVMMNRSNLLVDLKVFSSPKGLPSVNRTRAERGNRKTQTNETHSTEEDSVSKCNVNLSSITALI